MKNSQVDDESADRKRTIKGNEPCFILEEDEEKLEEIETIQQNSVEAPPIDRSVNHPELEMLEELRT